MAGYLGREADRREPDAWSALDVAQLTRLSGGSPLSPVMKTAATACELARKAALRERD